MEKSKSTGRRSFIQGAAWTGAALILPGGAARVLPAAPMLGVPAEAKAEEEISLGEDLMREHGVLNRVLLVYEEIMRRLRSEGDFDPAVVGQASDIIKRFIEDYHEKLEEDYLFPRFEKAGKLVELVTVLRKQHQAGRDVTQAIQAQAARGKPKNAEERRGLQELLAKFVRMYRPHEAREDTVLFPAFHGLVSAHEYDALGDEFEKKEHELFGEDGFEQAVARVSKLEKELGIYDLAQFTPSSPRPR